MIQTETLRSQPVVSPPDAWRNSLNPSLIQRLMRPVNQPGLVRTYPTQAILTRTQRLSDRLPLLTTLSQRYGGGEVLQPQTAPIVYAQLAQSDGGSPDATADVSGPSRPSEVAAADLPVVQPKPVVSTSLATGDSASQTGALERGRSMPLSNAPVEIDAGNPANPAGELPIVQAKALTGIDASAFGSRHLASESSLLPSSPLKPLPSVGTAAQTGEAITSVGPPIVQRSSTPQARDTGPTAITVPSAEAGDKSSVASTALSGVESSRLEAAGLLGSPSAGEERSNLTSLQRSPLSADPPATIGSTPNQSPIGSTDFHPMETSAETSDPTVLSATALPVVQPQAMISGQGSPRISLTPLQQPGLQRSLRTQSEDLSLRSVGEPSQSARLQKTDSESSQALPSLETPSPSPTAESIPSGALSPSLIVQPKPLLAPHAQRSSAAEAEKASLPVLPRSPSLSSPSLSSPSLSDSAFTVQSQPVSHHLGSAIVRRSPQSTARVVSSSPSENLGDTLRPISDPLPAFAEPHQLQRSMTLTSDAVAADAIPSVSSVDPSQIASEGAPSAPSTFSPPAGTKSGAGVDELPVVHPQQNASNPARTVELQLSQARQVIGGSILQAQPNPAQSNVAEAAYVSGLSTPQTISSPIKPLGPDDLLSVDRLMPIQPTWNQRPLSHGMSDSPVLTVQAKPIEPSRLLGSEPLSSKGTALSNPSLWVQRQPYAQPGRTALNHEIASHPTAIDQSSLSMVGPLPITTAQANDGDVAIQRRLAAQLQPEYPGAEANLPAGSKAELMAQVDVDELTDKIWHKFTRQLAIEHERRGGVQWG